MGELLADLESHHIEGWANVSGDHFSVPLISHVGSVLGGDLYHGGCVGGVDLRGRFDAILSLYPWEKYLIDERTVRIEERLYDADEEPALKQIASIASVVAGWLREGKRVLVHCQAGLNRSSLIVGTMLVREAGMTPETAISLIRMCRCEACLCNPAFEAFVRGLG